MSAENPIGESSQHPLIVEVITEIEEFLSDATPESAKLLAVDDVIEIERLKIARSDAINLSINAFTSDLRNEWTVKLTNIEHDLNIASAKRIQHSRLIPGYTEQYNAVQDLAVRVANAFHQAFDYERIPFYPGGVTTIAGVRQNLSFTK